MFGVECLHGLVVNVYVSHCACCASHERNAHTELMWVRNLFAAFFRFRGGAPADVKCVMQYVKCMSNCINLKMINASCRYNLC